MTFYSYIIFFFSNLHLFSMLTVIRLTLTTLILITALRFYIYLYQMCRKWCHSVVFMEPWLVLHWLTLEFGSEGGQRLTFRAVKWNITQRGLVNSNETWFSGATVGPEVRGHWPSHLRTSKPMPRSGRVRRCGSDAFNEEGLWVVKPNLRATSAWELTRALIRDLRGAEL